MARITYQFFDNFIIRTPFFSFKKFENILKTPELLIREYYSPQFLEALYLASPDLYEEVLKWQNAAKTKQTLPPLSKDLKNTLLKYFIRMSTRCTPFGLFSGVDLGNFSKNAVSSATSEHQSLIRDTKPDMHFLVALAEYLNTLPHIRKNLLFYPNNSLYYTGHKIRYIEYEYYKGKREHVISTVSLFEELENILKKAQNGLTISELGNMLESDAISGEEALEFVEELIQNQVLISELEPNVTGDSFWENMITILQKTGADSELILIKEIYEKIQQLDGNTSNNPAKYKEIEIAANQFPIEYERKYLLQTDLYYQNNRELSDEWKKKLKKAVTFLNKITSVPKETAFTKFKKAFYKRFEMQEASLSYVMDTEIGIGYLQHIQNNSIHPYLEDIVLPRSSGHRELNLKLSPAQQILNRKIQEALLTDECIIKLTDEDFNGFTENWTDLSDTISFLSEIITDNEEEKLVFTGGGGNSGASLLARFCSQKHGIKNHAEAIIQKENDLNPDVISAEIAHLPQSRIGNVLRRPALRKYEIPYGAKSNLSQEHQILVNDLYIRIRQDKMILYSKKLNREVKPYLTNAHNYSANSLPVYHFLSDYHSQNKRTVLSFSWGDLEQIYHTLPRVEYDGIILSKAIWKVYDKELQHLNTLSDNQNALLQGLKEWQKKRNIPNWIKWVISDNKLVINLQNHEMALLFMDIIKRKKTITIEEFLYHKEETFMHEYIFTAYKTVHGN
ncbi:lantibiotic dehydratase family protein [Chryseobacterium sp.]|uniref:lantibiotic dehydratase family protein n=1 Tax=Chryseobacterium sp. TaxID=1871047 RepID=UPI0025C1B3BC|nr:lantibiotic dehydratase family protein [Chryseobacterium sp.]MBV8324987.1 lantibiotic dehydratase family protein [Chryseobacterium sp.]